MFTAALFTRAETWEQPKSLAMDEWIKEMWSRYTVEYYSTMRKKKFAIVTIWADREGITWSEINQTKKNTAWYHVYVQCKKKKKKKTQTHRNRVGKWVPGPAGEEIRKKKKKSWYF